MDWMNVVFWLVGTLVVVLGPIILVHELGHFIFAKLAGVRVEEFGFGFPPRMLKLWRGKGHLEIGRTPVTIPAGFRLPSGLTAGRWVAAIVQQGEGGGYVLRRLKPLDPDVDDLRPEQERVDAGVRMRGELTVFEPGTLYSLNWLPIGGFVRMTGEEDPSDPRSLAAQPKRWRVAAIAAGPVVNIIVAFLLLIGAYSAGLPDEWLVQVAEVQPESAAAEAGLQPRDIILAVDGARIEEGMPQLRSMIRAVPEQTVEMTILRGQETLTLAATPWRDPEGYGLLGILMAPWPDRSALRRYPLPQALSAGVNDIATAVVMTLQVPARLAQGDITPQEARPTSVVGVSEVLTLSLQRSIEWGLAFPVLQTASFISLALGLTNLLPLPALDGGRILFIFVEAIRGRRMSPEREAMVHFVGLAVLLSLMAWVMLLDLFNPIIPWSWLR